LTRGCFFRLLRAGYSLHCNCPFFFCSHFKRSPFPERGTPPRRHSGFVLLSQCGLKESYAEEKGHFFTNTWVPFPSWCETNIFFSWRRFFWMSRQREQDFFFRFICRPLQSLPFSQSSRSAVVFRFAIWVFQKKPFFPPPHALFGGLFAPPQGPLFFFFFFKAAGVFFLRNRRVPPPPQGLIP